MTTSTTGLAPIRSRLANGAVVIAKESRVTPAVTIHAAVRAGSAFDPQGQAGLAHFVSRTIDRGTEHLTGDQIADELDRRGVSLTLGVNRHVLSLVCTCLEEDLEAVLAVLADIVVRPTFPSAEVETRRGEIVTLIRQDEDSPAAVARDTLLEMLYGADHPYGRRARGSAGSVEAVDRQALIEFHRARFRPSALSLVMVGAVDPSRAVDAAARVLEGWAGADVAPLVCPVVQPAATRRVRVAPMMNKAQADIACGFVTFGRADSRFYAGWLMNNILGQYSLGGRLGDSIRERQGMAYYASSAFDPDPIQAPLIVRAGVNPDNVARAVASIDAELASMAADGPTDQEIADSKRYLIGSMPRNLETHLGIASFLQTVEFFDLGLDYDVRLPALLEAVTRDDAHAVARALIDPKRAAVAVAGPYDGPLA
jgi:zinc protease